MTAFEEYLHALRGRQVAVLGIGVSNTPLLRLLAQAGACVTACDKKSESELGERAAKLRALGVQLYTGPDYLDGVEASGAELIFRTPGMRPDLPALARARARGAEVTSEMEDLSPSALAPSSPSPALTAKRQPPRSLPKCCAPPGGGSFWGATSVRPCSTKPGRCPRTTSACSSFPLSNL